MNHSYMMTLNTSPQNKGETIHDYYVRFTKLVNDMQNIKMTMPRMQLNSKFVNNMLPEWGDSSSETEQRLVRNQNDVASCLLIVANIRHMQLEQNVVGFNSVNTTGWSYKNISSSTYNQTPYSINTKNQAIVQDGKVVVQNVQGQQNRGQGNNLRGAGAAGNGRAQNRVRNANLSQARQIKYYNCNVQDLALNMDNVFQDDECDAFDLDVDEASTAQTMFMANLSSADPVMIKGGLSYDSGLSL
ncbi:hypothetical protein Tco_0255789 [Tanacetum coccineum]